MGTAKFTLTHSSIDIDIVHVGPENITMGYPNLVQ